MAVRPILFCSHVVAWGGAETVLADLLQALDRTQFAPHLACPGPGPLPDRAAALGIPVHHVPIGGASALQKALGLPAAARALRALAKRLDARLLYANTMIAGYAAVLAQTPELPCLWHLHVVTRSRIARCALRRATAVVTPSRAGALAIDARLGESARLAVVPNGVGAQFFAAAGTGLPAALGVAPGTPLVGIVGRIDPHKGLAVLLRALAALGDLVPAPHLVVVGGEAFADSQPRIGGHTAELRALAGELGVAGRVHFLGHRDDTALLMSQLDVVAVPSIALESAPRAVAEAQAAGRPVVASAIGGIPEMIEDGTTGILVPPGDAAALAAELRRLLRDPALRERLGSAGRTHAGANYSMARFAARIAAVCARVARA